VPESLRLQIVPQFPDINSREVKGGYRGILPFAKDPERDVSCSDVSVSTAGGDPARDRQRDISAAREWIGNCVRHVRPVSRHKPTRQST
jgi:hypothetical protein